MKITIDIDGTICSQTSGDYENAIPNNKAIEKINNWYNQGHEITFLTSRFMGRCKNDIVEVYKIGFDFTTKQLEGWGVKYHQLIMGKPRSDLIIDNASAFYRGDWNSLDAIVQSELNHR